MCNNRSVVVCADDHAIRARNPSSQDQLKRSIENTKTGGGHGGTLRKRRLAFGVVVYLSPTSHVRAVVGASFAAITCLTTGIRTEAGQ